jgi:inorganic pyrophosphatase
VSAGEDAPEIVNAYIEIVPTDVVKYELDKPSGHLRVDRPRATRPCASLYGFIPQTYCGDEVGQICAERTGLTGIKGDGDQWTSAY